MSKEFFDYYLEVVKSIVDLSKKRCGEDLGIEVLYRGEPQKYPYISSGLYRFLSDVYDWDALDYVMKNRIIIKSEELIARDIVSFEGGESVDRSHIDIWRHQEYMPPQLVKYFAEIQHLGGVTNLIDFTKDINIALVFACHTPNSLLGDEEGDGRIIIYYHDRKNRNGNDVLHFPKSGYSQFQSSIFIRPFENGILREDEDCVDIFDIPFEKKEPIVMVLKEYYNLTARSIFSDLNGYIRNQKDFLAVALDNLANK